jgi:hypothetical protein
VEPETGPLQRLVTGCSPPPIHATRFRDHWRDRQTGRITSLHVPSACRQERLLFPAQPGDGMARTLRLNDPSSGLGPGFGPSAAAGGIAGAGPAGEDRPPVGRPSGGLTRSCHQGARHCPVVVGALVT